MSIYQEIICIKIIFHIYSNKYSKSVLTLRMFIEYSETRSISGNTIQSRLRNV